MCIRDRIKFNPFNAHNITVQDIETIAKKQGVEFKQGDVIIIRSGFTEDLSGLSGEKQNELMGTHRTCGVTGDEATAKWFWNKHCKSSQSMSYSPTLT